MATMITEEEEGKKVVHGNDTVGRVVSVEHGTAHIEPDPGLIDSVKSRLGWAERDEDTYPLQESSIDEITDDEIRLRHDL